MTDTRSVRTPQTSRPGAPPVGGVEARLRRPWTRTSIVTRSGLVARLLAAADVRVVLLDAAAGSGKTTLLAQWAEADERPFGWVSLDETDGNPAVLIADVTRALDLVDIAQADGSSPFVLVLDGVHVLGGRSLALIAAMVDRLPAGCQIAIAGRGEPALPLARWSVQGDLLRLGTAELAMAPPEAAALMQAADLDLAPEELDVLLHRTEGWAAGLRLAAIRLHEEPDGGRAAARFGGQDQLVAAYLRDEVLAPLPAEQARFLTLTSVLERLCGPLCDAVLQATGSAAALRDAARSNPFVVPLEGAAGWYRWHRLLADALRAELRVHQPELEPELHRRASAWHEAQGEPAKAIEHARAAGDARRAAELVWTNLAPRLEHGDPASVERWLRGFADAELEADPALALAAAWCGLERGEGAAAQRWTAAAERDGGARPLSGGPSSVAAAAAILRAHAARDGLARMAEDAAHGQASEPGAWAMLCGLLLGVGWRLGGDAGRARTALTAVEQFPSAPLAPASLVQCLAQLAVLAIDDGDWARGEALVERAMALGEREGLRAHRSMIDVYAVSALAHARAGRPAEAGQDARRCTRLLGGRAHVPPWLAIDALVLVARASLLVGDVPASRGALREARRVLARAPDAGVLGARLDETWRMADAFRQAGVVAPAPLSRAELRILRFLPTHLSYREIGQRLQVSQWTVKSQALSAYRKLDVSSRSQAVERATALGLIRAGDAPA